MGGRYQMTQVDFSGCSLMAVLAAFVFALSAESCSVGLSRFSRGVLRSEPPGVLGAPKDAKAPDPRPNAEEAFVDGEDTPPESGDRALKGFDRPWELSGPKRFVRGSSTLAPSLPSVPVIDRDNLEELERGGTISDDPSKDYQCRKREMNEERIKSKRIEKDRYILGAASPKICVIHDSYLMRRLRKRAVIRQ